MKYKQGKQRVATGDVFPYPLKCWYDDENIYVKVLRIPEPWECKLSPYLTIGVRKGLYDIHKYNTKNNDDMALFNGYRGNYFDKLCVCLEIYSGKKILKRTSSKLYGKLRAHSVEHPSLPRGFYKKPNFPLYRAIKNQVYVFPITNNYFNKIALKKHSLNNPGFTKVRATFRFLTYGNAYQDSNRIPETTGIYSNIIIIKKK